MRFTERLCSVDGVPRSTMPFIDKSNIVETPLQTYPNPTIFSLAIFTHPDKWLFNQGLPPPIRDTRFWARGIRGSAIVTALGGTAGIINSTMELALSDHFRGFSAGALCGSVFSILVVVPLVRWFTLSTTYSVLLVFCGMAMHLPVFTPFEQNGVDAWIVFSSIAVTYSLSRSTFSSDTGCTAIASGLLAWLAIAAGSDGFGIYEAIHTHLNSTVASTVCESLRLIHFELLLGISLSCACWSAQLDGIK